MQSKTRSRCKVIAIGVGANLPHPRFGGPKETCEAALEALERRGVDVLARSRWYRSAPVPASGQPDFVNGIAAVSTDLSPGALLAVLHEIEREFGRVRTERNAPRVIDLDLIAYHDRVLGGAGDAELPHPRMHLRAFVLLPLREIAPDWRHPVLGRTVEELISALPDDQDCSTLC